MDEVYREVFSDSSLKMRVRNDFELSIYLS
jgi:hypothetical protein